MRRVEEPPKKAVLLNAGEERVETPLGVPAFLKEKKSLRRVDPTSASGQATRNRYGCCQGPHLGFHAGDESRGEGQGSKFKPGGGPLRPPPSPPFRRQSRRFATPGGDRKRRARGEVRRRSDRLQETTWASAHLPPPWGPLAHERDRERAARTASAQAPRWQVSTPRVDPLRLGTTAPVASGTGVPIPFTLLALETLMSIPGAGTDERTVPTGFAVIAGVPVTPAAAFEDVPVSSV
ncbi:hypothetical protein BHM03_00030798 [Ensete ventricosum]|nr:hypothetical protein BHM03_00030798 [Ensete ventricosum]